MPREKCGGCDLFRDVKDFKQRGDEERRCRKCYFAPQPEKVGMQTAPRLRYSLVCLRALPYLAFGRVLGFISNSPSSHSVVSCKWMDVPPTTRRTAARCALNPKPSNTKLSLCTVLSHVLLCNLSQVGYHGYYLTADEWSIARQRGRAR